MTTPEARPDAVAVTEAEVKAAASVLDYPSVYMVGPSKRSQRQARSALEAAAQVRFAQDHGGEANEMIGEVERLRGALITAGRNVGAILDSGVSTDFLMHVPEEVRLKVERLKEGDRNVNIALNRQARRIAELQEQLDLAMVHASDLKTALAASEVRTAKAVKVLRMMDADRIELSGRCPCCRAHEDEDHAADCSLATLLSNHPAPEPGVKAGEVLAFYADPKSYVPTGWQGDMNPSPVMRDRGEKARLALAQAQRAAPTEGENRG